MMAGHLAFIGLVSLFPFVIFTIAVAGSVGDTTAGQDAIVLALSYLPAEVAAALSKPINHILSGTPRGVLTVSGIVALWTASSGLDAARVAVRRAFHWAKVQPALKRRAQSIGIAAVAPLFVLPIMALQVGGPALWDLIGGGYFDQGIIEQSWRLLRLLITPTILFFVLCAAFFVFAPYRIRPIAIWPGALTTAVLWLTIANGLSLYLRNLADYQSTYGSLAGTMVTLVFFFLLAIAFVFGAEVNAAVTELRKGGDLGTALHPSAPTPQSPPDA